MFNTKLRVSKHRPSPSRQRLSSALMRPRAYPKSIALLLIAVAALVALGESLLTIFSRIP